ncbi:helix-turn-helix domain-containing protein [Paenibacillus arenilitoris]|uniref:AraC family transcriptional regulator n=1 Tax=Paenibacillus arenilitoris TaxID=2772299 RepID=A0A927H4B6_9BACL|nr:helix-turn-helix domain-containing protein [Paenibacillus arenilitoris]MBD2867303.1 AraC family transcriptional regulator [Paenibacillus arenilitoris]
MQTITYRIFLKYLISHLVLLLVPITITTFVVFGFFVDRLQEELIAGNLNTLDKVRYSMDEQLKQVQQMTNQLVVEDNSLYPYRISDNWGYKSFGIVRELKRFRMHTPFVREIWLSYRGEEVVYTSSSVYSRSMLADRIYRFEDWPKEKLLQDLNAETRTTILPPATDLNSGERYMRMIVPLFPYQNYTDATMVFLINEASLHSLMETYTPSSGAVWILDQNGRPLTGIGAELGPAGASVAEHAALQGDDPNQEWTIDGKSYYFFLVQSELTGWKYVTVLPVNEAMQKVEQARQFYLYGVVCILAFGGAIIFFSLRWNYWPIHRLRLASDRVLPARTKGLNELETVQYALDTLSSQNRLLGERVKSQSQAVKRQLLLALLKGEFDTEDELRVYGEENGFPISGSPLATAIVEFPAGASPGAYPSAEEMEKLAAAPFRAYGMEHFEMNRYVLVFMTDKRDLSPEQFRSSLNQFRDALCASAGGVVTVGAGSISDITGAPRSYLEAKTAIGYRFIQGVNRTIFYEDIPVRSEVAEEYPHKNLKVLKLAIKSGNTGKINGSISGIIGFIRERQPPLAVVRGLCFDMIRIVDGGWREMGLNEQSPSEYPDIFDLERLETIDEFERLMLSVSADLSRAFDCGPAAEEPSGARSAEDMLQYIQRNYRNSGFSLQDMSDHYGMALPNLSSYFKENNGLTPLEYTTSLRMADAKELLVSTPHTLKAIAEDVGYNNVCSFIRRFKQLTGMTPGEYRAGSKEGGLPGRQ